MTATTTTTGKHKKLNYFLYVINCKGKEGKKLKEKKT